MVFDYVNDDTFQSQISEYDITSSPNDFNIGTIYHFIESGSLKIPAFQRNYVWDIKRASKLVESILIGLPIPQIFLYEKARNEFHVIDGQQRLMTIYYFKKGRFPRREKRGALRSVFDEHGRIPDDVLASDDYFRPFSLQLPNAPNRPQNKFNRSKYVSLGEFQSTFDLRTIRNVIVKQNQPADDNSSIYEIFHRLNTGGTNLKAQEIRMSLYHSDFYDMLFRINSIRRWRQTLGVDDPDLHMKDIEILLRGFAMLASGAEYQPPMTAFLNSASGRFRKLERKDVNYFDELFRSFLAACADLPEQPFSSARKQFNISLYEAVFTAVCRGPFANRTVVKRKLRPEQVEALQADAGFIGTTQFKTAEKNNVDLRLSIALEKLGG